MSGQASNTCDSERTLVAKHNFGTVDSLGDLVLFGIAKELEDPAARPAA